MDMTPLQKPWHSPPGPATPASGSPPHSDDAFLFETPGELVCPITQAVFYEPVLTASGHVYERAAIEHYLRHNDTDPMTRQPLVNKSLTPVFVLKSRAAEYREKAAKLCIERACSRGCPDPVRYLRRAVELVADANGRDLGVRGLSQETIDYVVSHPSNAYDRLALQCFAQGLFESGYRDRASAVFYHLITSGSDRRQQAQLLKQCLACWTQGGLPGAASPARGGPGALALLQGSGGSGNGAAGLEDGNGGGGNGMVSAGALAAATADPHVYEKLVLLFEGQAAVSWGQIIDMAGEAGLGQEFVVRLCEQLLFRPMPRGDAGGSSGDLTLLRGGEQGGSGNGMSWGQEKEILLKYVRVLCEGVRECCTETARRLDELEGYPQGSPGMTSSPSVGALAGSGSRTGSGQQGALQRRWLAGRGGARGRGGRGGAGRPAWLSHPAVVACCMLVAVLADPHSPAGRIVGAMPLLALLPPAQ